MAARVAGGVRLDHQRSLKRDVVARLGALDFIAAKKNVILLGPPGAGRTHLAKARLRGSLSSPGDRLAAAFHLTADEYSLLCPSPDGG